MNEINKFSVGCRIESGGYYGTVRFIGKLQKHEAAKVQDDVTWVGIEWDIPSRGKHNGNFGGIQYFTTCYPTGGSFLRPEKCNTGISFLTALVDRYCGAEANTKLSEISIYPEKTHEPEVNSVDIKDTQRIRSCLIKLTAASVCGLFVREGSTDGDIASFVANVRELDLSMNLLSEWSEVAVIINHMPQLKILNVSDNRLKLLSDTLSVSYDVEILYLNRMEYSWFQVSLCAQYFSHLKELHACFNHIDRIENVRCSPFTDITLVNVEGNPIASWEALLPLSDLPQLRTLIANECGLASIHFPGSSMPADCFCALVSLSVSRNAIADWRSISELNRLRSLTSLRFVSNPLSRDSSGRHTAVAKIARLQWCNGAEVLPIERRDAELDYLRLYSSEWASAGGSVSLDKPLEDAFILEHPRYVELVHKYGPVEESEMHPKKSSALKNNLVTVNIQSKHSQQLITKRLPTKMTVQKLKVLVQRAFKIGDVSSIRLVYLVMKQPPDETASQDNPSQVDGDIHSYVEMDNDLRELDFYSLENNAVIDAEW